MAIHTKTGKYYIKLKKWFYSILSEININKHPGLNINQPVLAIGLGKISCGSNVTLGYFPSPYFYSGNIHLEVRRPSAEIIFGSDIMINNNFTIICEQSLVKICDHVLIGTNVEVIDSNFHSVHPDRRHDQRHPAAPVIIEENVFVGSNVRILKGVTIGANSIVSNGSVVFESMPANCIISGNPAAVVSEIKI